MVSRFVLTIIVGNYYYSVEKKTGRGTYKYQTKLQNRIFLMEGTQPRSLDEYCSVFKVDFFNVRLRCIFCLFYASLTDLANFFDKKLSLVWRGETPYVCCIRCARHSAKIDREKYTLCAVKCDILDAVVGKPLKEIVIRCSACFALLDQAEKLDACAREQLVLLIRGHWRTECRLCKV
jgi:hypothetical protein